jgi:hypothetical protein
LDIENYAYIKFMRLPPGWVEVPLDDEGFDIRALRIFSPPETAEVRLELLNRGYPLGQDDAETFRQLLTVAPKVIFERKDKEAPSKATVSLLEGLAEVLGNVGNNQVVNTSTDDLGPCFMLDRIDILNWKGKNVLAARGWFRDPEEDIRVNDYCGFFIDSNPFDPECQVEEVFLEAPTEELLLRYMPVFKECLNSLEWQ